MIRVISINIIIFIVDINRQVWDSVTVISTDDGIGKTI